MSADKADRVVCIVRIAVGRGDYRSHRHQLFQSFQKSLFVCVTADHQKFIAAVAVAGSFGKALLQRLAGFGNGLVSFGMTIFIIDLFKVVNVHHHDVKILVFIRVVVVAQRKPVSDPGQAVHKRHFLKNPVIFLESQGHFLNLFQVLRLSAFQCADKKHINKNSEN